MSKPKHRCISRGATADRRRGAAPLAALVGLAGGLFVWRNRVPPEVADIVMLTEAEASERLARSGARRIDVHALPTAERAHFLAFLMRAADEAAARALPVGSVLTAHLDVEPSYLAVVTREAAPVRPTDKGGLSLSLFKVGPS